MEAGRQYSSPSIARLTTGGYVIAWAASPATDGISTADMCFQRYDASGAGTGASTCIAGAHRSAGGPSVVARPDGGFTIIWNEASNSTDLSGLHWQDYDQSGNAQGAIQSGPLPISLSAQRLVGGGYVKLLQTAGQVPAVTFQLYAPDGAPIGSPQPVADKAQLAGGVVALAGGGFAVVWLQNDGSSIAGMTRAFSADGTPLGEPVPLAPNTLGPINCGRNGTVAICPAFQNLSGVIATDDGGYIVAWADGTGLGTGGDSFARQFRADGSPAGAVVGRIGNGVIGPIAAVSPDAFVMAISDAGGISALHVVAVPLR